MTWRDRLRKWRGGLAWASLRRRKAFRAAAAAVGAALALVGYAMVSSVLWLNPLAEAQLLLGGDGKWLYVLTHGYQGGPAVMEDARDALREAHPDADLLMLRYPAHAFSNAKLESVADAICELIERHSARLERPVEKIVLVGHSVGALLLRKALVYGHGRIRDLPASLSAERSPMSWVRKVDRLVLLAGCNRGWSLEERSRGMRPFKRLYLRAGFMLGEYTGTGRLILGCRSGEPFVSNLRVQWMDLHRDQARGVERFPEVVQLIGDEDDVVSAEDDKDVGVAKGFHYLRLQQTNHGSILDFRDPNQGSARKERFLLALRRGEEGLQAVRAAEERPPWKMDDRVKHVVFVLHGIRDIAEWGEGFREPLKKAYLEAYPGETPESLKVDLSEYGYFSLLDFITFSERQEKVRWFMDRYTEVKALYPKIERIDFIGHSHGTYVLGAALDRYHALTMRRVVATGSVLRRSFRWSRFIQSGQVEAVKNYAASADWVVGIFPAASEAIGIGDLGSAGFNGFTEDASKTHQVRFVKGGHSAAIAEGIRPSIAGFIMHGSDVPIPADLGSGEQEFWPRLFSKMCVLVWILLILVGLALPTAAGWLVWRVRDPATGKTRYPFLAGATGLSTLALLYFILSWI